MVTNGKTPAEEWVLMIHQFFSIFVSFFLYIYSQLHYIIVFLRIVLVFALPDIASSFYSLCQSFLPLRQNESTISFGFPSEPSNSQSLASTPIPSWGVWPGAAALPTRVSTPSASPGPVGLRDVLNPFTRRSGNSRPAASSVREEKRCYHKKGHSWKCHIILISFNDISEIVCA